MPSRGTGADADSVRSCMGERNCSGAASRARRRAWPKLRGRSLAAKMRARCVGPGRSRRGVRRPRARRWGARSPQGYGTRRRARGEGRGARCASAARLLGGRQPPGRRAAEPAAFRGANEALGTPGNAGSTEAARDPRAVWVNGAVGEPEVVGPAGSVWVTRSGEEEADDVSPRRCQRKGRPGALGHDSILELWLKVQAMRVASGCWEGSGVELHPMPAGEGPVEKGVPGRASWVETSRAGVTGPWVRGHVRAFSRASGLPTARGLRPRCVRALGFCSSGQTGRASLPVGGPGTVEKIGCTAASGSWERTQAEGMTEATAWPEAVGRAQAREVGKGCGGAPGPNGARQPVQNSGPLVQDAVYGDTSGLWGRGQAARAPDALLVSRALEEETPPLGPPEVLQRRQKVEDRDSGGIPGLWVTGQPVGLPCASEEGSRCGGKPGSWVTAQTIELSGSGEQEAESPGVQGLWDIEQAIAAPQALGKEADNAGVPRLWGTGQLPGMSQLVALSGGRGAETSCDGIPGLSGREQTLGTPLAEAAPGLAVEETHNGNVSLWERRQVIREQEGPAALGAAESVDQDAGCGALSCLCGRRQAVGVFETVVMPKHRCVPEGVPMSLGMPAAMWVSGPVCQESNSRDGLSLQERARVAQMSVVSRRPMASEECSSVVEDIGSEALPGSWGRRPAVEVSVAPEVPDSLEVETGSRDFSGLSGRRQTSDMPVSAGVSSALEPMAPRAPSSLLEQTGSGRVSGLAGGRPSVGMSMAVELPESTREETVSESLHSRQAAGMPLTARVAMPMDEPPASGLLGLHSVVDSGCGEGLEVWQRSQVMEVPTAARVPKLKEEAGSEGVSGLWRRHSGTVPEVVRGPLSQGMPAVVGIPIAGHIPAAFFVTGSPGEEADKGVSDLPVVRRQPTEGAGSSGEQMGSRGILELVGRSHTTGVTYTNERARLWGSPRSGGEETAYENVHRMSRTRAAVPLVSREETGVGHFRHHLQQNGRRPMGEVPGVRGRGNDLGEDYVGEERMRVSFH